MNSSGFLKYLKQFMVIKEDIRFFFMTYKVIFNVFYINKKFLSEQSPFFQQFYNLYNTYTAH